MIKFWLAKQVAELIPYLILLIGVTVFGLWINRKKVKR